jgi:ATP-binding cassette subfamily F protein uup
VLDEPTNDLDVETLELLEEILLEFDGTVLLVSHDREFMDNVVTSIFVLEGEGRVAEYVGGYSSWAQKGGRLVNLEQPADEAPEPGTVAKPAVKPAALQAKPAKLSYKDKRELEALPGVIDQLERRQEELAAAISDPAFYQQDHEATQRVIADLAKIRADLEGAYARWQELEG